VVTADNCGRKPADQVAARSVSHDSGGRILLVESFSHQRRPIQATP